MLFFRRAGLVLAVISALGFVTLIAADWLAQPPSPDLHIFIARAAQYRARIVRDNFGVPHIFGHRDADVAFGLGFAHSEDDFATIQEVALATRGQLAANDGVHAAVGDYLVHFLRVWETVNARYARDVPLSVQRVLQGYADGINYYAALHPDRVDRGLLPLTGKDIAAGFVFKTPLFYGLGDVLKRLNDSPNDKSVPVGSNGVAVAPSRSADHATRLLVNSHQPYTGAVAWYEAVLQSDEGWHVAGGFFPGSPFMLHGHNEHLGWANTVNEPDLVDVYRLKVNPQNNRQYWLDGRWRNFHIADAAIRVKLFGPLFWTVHRDVLFSEHGPVLKTEHGVFAIRYAGMNEIRQVVQYYRLNKARNLAEWRAAMALQALPSINYIYADEKGNIGYVYNAQFPLRKPGFDWKHIQSGDRSDLIWHGYVPFARVPQIWNPKSGFVFNSNNTPFQATGSKDNLKAADFPAWMGIQSNMTNRAWRALETFGADNSISAQEFHKYKFDLAYSHHSELAKEVAEVLAIDPRGDVDLQAAQRILHRWDYRTDRNNRGTALAVLMGIRAASDEIGGPRKMSPANALKQAIAFLKAHFGRLDPKWAQVNRVRRGTVDLAIDGGPDVFRAVYGAPQSDGTLTAEAGDTLIMFVTWDKNGRLSSDSIHQFGSATSDSASRHYADQTPLFVAMRTKPVLFTRDELRGHVEANYAPGVVFAVKCCLQRAN